MYDNAHVSIESGSNLSRDQKLICLHFPLIFCSEKRILTQQNLPSHLSPRALAPRVERLLFTKAPSVEAYRDLKTLPVRCQRLLSVLLRRQAQEKEQAKAVLKLRRKKALIAILGGETKYQEVLDLVQKAQRLQGEVGPPFRTSKEGCSGAIPAPPTQRNRSLEPPLVHCFHTTPVASLGDLQWDEMIEECQFILSS